MSDNNLFEIPGFKAEGQPAEDPPRVDLLVQLSAELERQLPAAIRLRHRIHAQPFTGGNESATRDLVLAALPGSSGLNMVAGTGAVLRIGGGGPAIAVRAELDALNLQEETGVPWASRRTGVMHACGHDVHMAALVALACSIDKAGGPAPLLVVPQAREETYPCGARDIAEDGILGTEQCRAMIGAHVQPLLSVGHVACTPGVVNASSDEFTLTVRGSGGHAAYPHLTCDPVIALAHVVVALQTLVSRGIDPMSSVVLSVTTLAAGTGANVVPDVAVARGTIRTMSAADRHNVLERMIHVAKLVAQANACVAEVEVTRGEPTLENDARLAHNTVQLLQPSGLQSSDVFRSPGSDDFSYFSERMPALMMFVGTDGEGGQLHSSTFLPADSRVRDVSLALLAGYLAGVQTYL